MQDYYSLMERDLSQTAPIFEALEANDIETLRKLRMELIPGTNEEKIAAAEAIIDQYKKAGILR